MDTNRLKKFAQGARTRLTGMVANKLRSVLAANSSARREAPKAIAELESGIREKGEAAVIDFVAYTWFNRFCALRYMDVMGYNPVRIVSPLPGHTQPEILEEAKGGNYDDTLITERSRVGRIKGLLDGSISSPDSQTEAYKLLLVSACNAYNRSMPFLFQPISDYTELLTPDDLLSDGSMIASTCEAIPPEVAASGVEVIGWLYQFYISEKKDEVMGKTVKTEDIPAATQLFTPDWIVRYLVENSLGRLWMLNHPGSKLADSMEYYIPPMEQDTDFLKVASPKELKICDPCCGSGHMLTYAFDLLEKIYEEAGYAPREIPSLILNNNLYGVEIDPRAGELAAFALTMKAREYDSRFLRRENAPKPNICVLQNISFTEEETAEYLNFIGEDLFTSALQKTLHQFEKADCCGSLIVPQLVNAAEALTGLENKKVSDELLLDAIHRKVLAVIRQADYLSPKYQVVVTNPPYMGGKGMNADLKKFAGSKYPDSKSDLMTCFMERVVTLAYRNGFCAMINLPSWMFLSSFERLREKLIRNIRINSLLHLGRGIFGSDFGTVAFVIQNVPPNGGKGVYRRLFEQHVQVRSVNKIRELFLDPTYGHYEFDQLDFERIPGNPIVYWLSEQHLCAFCNKPVSEYIDLKAGMSTGDNTIFERLWYEVSYGDTSFITNELAETYNTKWYPCHSGGEFRKWYGNHETVANWLNNGEQIRNFGKEQGKVRSAVRNETFYFKEGITWSKISSGKFASRYRPTGYLFDDTGRCGFSKTQDILFLVLGLFCSEITNNFLTVLCPTLSFTSGEIAKIPFCVFFTDVLLKNVKDAIYTTKTDWDSYETSWDFQENPLIRLKNERFVPQTPLRIFYEVLRQQWAEATGEMRFLEMHNNGIFIDAYGLQDELNSDVPWEEITLTCNPWYRYGKKAAEGQNTGTALIYNGSDFVIDRSFENIGLNHFPYEKDLESRLLEDTVKEFISYAVGCMMGRYSLAIPGLVIANQGESVVEFLEKHNQKLRWGIPQEDSCNLNDMYQQCASACGFMPDEDGILPILDDEWFVDDIVAQFKAFLKATFRTENFVENLEFIEKALGKDIRKYFVRDFYKDHVQRYKKRPIYWMFSSPKGSFNALIYMHRYQPDTVSIVLNEYLREFMTRLRVQREHLIADNNRADLAPAEKTRNMKLIDKYAAMFAELEAYERDTLFPLAQKQIAIDLDDGVKVNYLKFGDALKKIPGLEAKEE